MADERQSIRLPAELGSIGEAASAVRSAAAKAGLSEADLLTLDLVMEELLANITLHAYGTRGAGHFEVSYAVYPEGSLAVEISDEGAAFNPVAAEPPDLDAPLGERRIGGLGIVLIKSLVPSLTYRRDAERNVVAFQFPTSGSEVPGDRFP